MVASSSPKGALWSGAAGGRGGASRSRSLRAVSCASFPTCPSCRPPLLVLCRLPPAPNVVLGQEPFVSRAGCHWSLPASSPSFFIKSTCTWPSLCAQPRLLCRPSSLPPVHSPCPHLGLAFPHHASLGAYFPLVSVFMHLRENPWVGPRAREPFWPSACPLGRPAPCTHRAPRLSLPQHPAWALFRTTSVP